MKPIVNQAILGFTRDEATRLSGLSEGQLRDWSDGLYAPHWSSGLYSFQDLVALRTLAKLRKDFGIRPAQLKRASAFLRKQSDRPWSSLKLGVGPKKRVYFWDPGADRWLSADDAEQSITPVALEPIVTQLTRDVKNERSRPKTDLGHFEKTRGVCGGKLRFKGTRVTVDAVKALVRQRLTTKQILEEYPSLTASDVAAARKLSAA